MKDRFLKLWLVVIIWMVLVYCASSTLGRPENSSHFLRPILHWLFPKISEERFEQFHFLFRKTLHLLEYAVLGLLIWRLIYFDPALAVWKPTIYGTTLLFVAFYASSDEFHQKFVPGREPAVHDVALDTAGGGVALFALWTRRRMIQAP